MHLYISRSKFYSNTHSHSAAYIYEHLNRDIYIYILKKTSCKVHHKNIKSKLTTFAPFTYVSFCVFYNGRGAWNRTVS